MYVVGMQLAKVTLLPEGSQNVFELIEADGLDLTVDIVEQVDLYKAVRDILEQTRDWCRALLCSAPVAMRASGGCH